MIDLDGEPMDGSYPPDAPLSMITDGYDFEDYGYSLCYFSRGGTLAHIVLDGVSMCDIADMDHGWEWLGTGTYAEWRKAHNDFGLCPACTDKMYALYPAYMRRKYE